MMGKLWVIEGADGSGKKTQADLLVERLNMSGAIGENSAHYWTFPTYEDPVWGKLIREYLSNASQKAEDVDPKYASLLYAADRGKASEKFKPLLDKGDWIICDRYIQSNMAFQAAKIKDVAKKNEFIDWLEDKEYNYFGIPQADGVVYLSLPIEVSFLRTQKRAKEAEGRGETLGDKVKKIDIHEQDKQYLEKARSEYLRLAQTKSWHVVECVENGRELSIEEIGEKIWQIVKPS